MAQDAGEVSMAVVSAVVIAVSNSIKLQLAMIFASWHRRYTSITPRRWRAGLLRSTSVYFCLLRVDRRLLIYIHFSSAYCKSRSPICNVGKDKIYNSYRLIDSSSRDSHTILSVYTQAGNRHSIIQYQNIVTVCKLPFVG